MREAVVKDLVIAPGGDAKIAYLVLMDMISQQVFAFGRVQPLAINGEGYAYWFEDLMARFFHDKLPVGRTIQYSVQNARMGIGYQGSWIDAISEK